MPPAKKAPRKKAQKKASKKTKRSSNVPDYASISCKRSMDDSGRNYATNALYSLMNTQLSDFPRAVQVAQAFQHYRIKKIKVTWKPTYDTFIGAVGTTVSKPNLYYMVDKAGSVPTNITLEGLKGMGSRPKQLDETNLSFEWSPSVLESSMIAGGGAGVSASNKYTISPWLTTTAQVVSPGAFVASGVDHLGLYWYVDQLVNLQAAYAYTMEVEVQFEFKKPLNSGLISAIHAKPATLCILNDSPDGIVGGGDGV